jgi:hypothetical protein
MSFITSQSGLHRGAQLDDTQWQSLWWIEHELMKRWHSSIARNARPRNGDGWEKKNGNYKYAIANDDRLYPVKEIVAEATGVQTASFSGCAAMSWAFSRVPPASR